MFACGDALGIIPVNWATWWVHVYAPSCNCICSLLNNRKIENVYRVTLNFRFCYVQQIDFIAKPQIYIGCRRLDDYDAWLSNQFELDKVSTGKAISFVKFMQWRIFTFFKWIILELLNSYIWEKFQLVTLYFCACLCYFNLFMVRERSVNCFCPSVCLSVSICICI